MQNVRTMQEPTKKKGKNLPTGTPPRRSLSLTRSLSVQIIAAADQRVAFCR